MKKYVKPELFYEHFELNQHIADCGWELNHTADNCTAQADSNHWGDAYNKQLFATEGQGCTVTDVERYCYQNGGDDTPIAFKVYYS